MDDFRLYIAGQTHKSRRIIDGLNLVLSEQMQQNYRIEIIDLLAQPKKAAHDNVIVTPTLVRVSSTTTVKIIGDLTNAKGIKRMLQSDGNKG